MMRLATLRGRLGRDTVVPAMLRISKKQRWASSSSPLLQMKKQRWVSSSSSPKLLQTEPPFVVRGLLVGGMTALATPLLPVIGLNQLAFRWLDVETRMVLTGGSSMAYFSCAVLAPEMFRYAPVLLPFAVSNAVTASGLYYAADYAAGGPRNLKNFAALPVAGATLGVLTAVLAPLTYPAAWALCVDSSLNFGDPDLRAALWRLCYDFNGGAQYALPCLATTGLAAGSVLQGGLGTVLTGVDGWPWPRLAGVVLGVSAIALAALYYSGFRSGIPHLRDAPQEAVPYFSFFSKGKACYVDDLGELAWVPSLDLETAEPRSERSSMLLEDGGAKAADAKLLAGKALNSSLRVYSSRKGALVDSEWLFATVPKEAVRIQRELQKPAEALLSDLLVLLVAGRVPQDKLLESLKVTLPIVREHVTARLDSEKGLLMQLAGVHAAELRELARVTDGGCEPFEAAQPANLHDSLTKAGVSVDRALESLRTLGCRISTEDRQADLAIITGDRRQARWRRARETVVPVAVCGALLAACFLPIMTGSMNG